MKDAKTRELEINADDLFREEIFTDRGPGSIRQLTPVRADGSDDPDRKPLYVGHAQLLTPLGPVPLNFEIEADSLGAAIENFSTHAERAV